MNCTWEDIPGSVDSNGWRRVRCIRCNFETAPTPHPHERIFCRCRALWPQAHELGEWLRLLIAAVFPWAKHCYKCRKRAAKLNTLVARVAVAFRRWVG